MRMCANLKRKEGTSTRTLAITSVEICSLKRSKTAVTQSVLRELPEHRISNGFVEHLNTLILVSDKCGGAEEVRRTYP